MKARGQGRNAAAVKQENRALIMREIRRAGGMSRIDLARRTGLTKGGLTTIIQELAGLGLLRETGTADTPSGRKPTLLQIRPDAGYAIAIDWTRTGIWAALVDMTGTIAAKRRVQMPATARQALDAMGAAIADITAACAGPVLGIGVVAPGPIDMERGEIRNPPNFGGLHDIPLVARLAEAAMLPVFLDNNASAHALAEREFGYGRQYEDFIELIVDEGIGGGIVYRGELLRGHWGGVSELGHITLDMHGARCACGNHGCAELYAAIPQMIRAHAQRHPEAAGTDFAGIVAGAGRGDAACLDALSREAVYLGNLCITLVNLFAPQAIVLGSAIAEAGAALTQPLAAYLAGRTMPRNSVEVVVSKLTHASLLGGATAVFDHFFAGRLGTYEEVLGKHNAERMGTDDECGT